MAYNTLSFDKRIKENIKNYSIENLYPIGALSEYFKSIACVTNAEILLTDRHGEKIISYGDFQNFKPDVATEPGVSIRICDRTIGHLYVRKEKVLAEQLPMVESMLETSIGLLARMGEQTYLYTESSIYIDELEETAHQETKRTTYSEKEDPLTGVYNKTYFEKRMEIIDRSEVVPVAIVNININDWKYANDHFGDEQSDRLIQIIAGIVKEEAKPDYVIGRVDGDVFVALIPMAEDGEAEDYMRRVQEKCNTYEDTCLAPSVACGMVYKTNVEETIVEKLSDAEYEMLENKFQIKNAPGYRERLEKKI